MATKETDLERQQRLAAENDDFQSWVLARRAEQQVADQAGGLINGMPAGTVVDATQVEVLPANPQGTAGNPALVAQNAQRIRSEGLAANEQREATNAARYAQFLGSQGINPNTIGSGRKDSSGNFSAPSLREEQAAESARLADNGRRARNNIAAGRLDRRGGYAQANELRDQNAAFLPRVGGRSSENARDYYLDYFLNRAEPVIGPIGNGFKAIDYSPASNGYGYNV